MGEWYRTGAGGAAAAAKKLDEKGTSVFRWFLRENSTKELVFLDDTCFVIDEHNLKVNGKWGNFFTCVGQENGCSFCSLGDSKFTGFYSVVDLTGYIDKNGQQKGKNAVLLFPAHPKVVQKIEDLKNMSARKSLVGCRFKVTRSGGKDYSTGSGFSFVIDYGDKVLEKFKPVDYQKQLRPLSQQDAAMMVNKINGSGFGMSSDSHYGNMDSGFGGPLPEVTHDHESATPQYDAPSMADIPF